MDGDAVAYDDLAATLAIILRYGWNLSASILNPRSPFSPLLPPSVPSFARFSSSLDDQAEQDHAWTLAGGKTTWIGGTDSATEGEWLWSDGTQFWTGGFPGSPVPSVYADWCAARRVMSVRSLS